MPTNELPFYTPRREFKHGNVESYESNSLPSEWLTLVPERMGFPDVPSMQKELGSFSVDALPKSLHNKMQRLFSAHFNKEQFAEPIELCFDDSPSLFLPNPYTPVEGSTEAEYVVSGFDLSGEGENIQFSVRWVEIWAECALQPASHSLQTICDWLAKPDPMEEEIPRAAIKGWLLENGQAGSLVDHEEFIQALIWGIERKLDDTLNFNLTDALFDLADGGVFIEAGEGATCIERENPARTRPSKSQE